MALGEQLRQARVRRNLSASQVAAATKMLVQTVEEIEREDFSHIAAPFYGRGFIKLFAECVGLDPAPLVDEYVRIVTGGHPPVPPAEPPPPAPETAVSPTAAAPTVEPAPAEPPSPSPMALKLAELRAGAAAQHARLLQAATDAWRAASDTAREQVQRIRAWRPPALSMPRFEFVWSWRVAPAIGVGLLILLIVVVSAASRARQAAAARTPQPLPVSVQVGFVQDPPDPYADDFPDPSR